VVASHVVEDGVKEELPGGGPEGRLQLKAAQRQVLQGGGEAVWHEGRLVGTRDLTGGVDMRPGAGRAYPEH
jgi:hypothetical protein